MTLIGRRERFEDIREVWKRETDFSDWLATSAGLALIADDIGIEIENVKRESRPGDYPCDLVGNLLGEESHAVIIENQFGRTDHDHLGKLLTYAAVHQAMTGIWITETASDDHRKVVDWLNDNTPASVSFYLAELKLYRIGNSPVAPQLDVVCRPNLTVKRTLQGDLSTADRERHEWRRGMWEEIHAAITQANPPFRLQRASDSHWSSIAIGHSAFHINLLLTPRTQSIGVELNIHPRRNKDAVFRQLEAQRTTIEAELGTPLQWMPLPGKRTARIILETKIAARDPANREMVKTWFVENSLPFYRAFRDRVNKLSLELGNEEPFDEDDAIEE